MFQNVAALKEANVISVELQKLVEFQYTILTDTTYYPIPPDLISNSMEEKLANTMSASTIFPISESITGSDPGTSLVTSVTNRPAVSVVAVEVKDMKNQARHFWPLSKLRERLDRMRELYERETEIGIGLSMEPITGSDPFYDRFHWFQMIGRGLVFITNILLRLGLIQHVTLVDHHGQGIGTVSVAIQPLEEAEATTNRFVLSFQSKSDSGSNSPSQNVTPSETSNALDSGNALPIKSYFRITIVNISGLSPAYADVFCQFGFMGIPEATFMTDPLRNDEKGGTLGFYHSQDVSCDF